MQATALANFRQKGYKWDRSKMEFDFTSIYEIGATIVLDPSSNLPFDNRLYNQFDQRKGETANGENGVHHVKITGSQFVPEKDPNCLRAGWPDLIFYRSGVDNIGVSYRADGNTITEIYVSQYYDATWWEPEYLTARTLTFSSYDPKKKVSHFLEVDYACRGKRFNTGDPSEYQDCHFSLFERTFTVRDIEMYEVPSVDWDAIINKYVDKHKQPWGIKTTCCKAALSGFTANTNNIANLAMIGDLAHGIMSIADGKWKGVEQFAKLSRRLSHLNKKSLKQAWKSASSTWLGYRYSYLTTKSDIDSMYNWIDKTIVDRRSRKVARASSSSDEGQMFMKIVFNDHKLSSAQSLWSKLKVTGLAPDLYNLWDLVPYSFCVDWISPIGDILNDISSQWMWKGYFDVISATYSWNWDDVIDDPLLKPFNVKISYYDRSVESHLPAFEYFSYSGNGPSNKTKIKRICDGAALFF